MSKTITTPYDVAEHLRIPKVIKALGLTLRAEPIITK